LQRARERFERAGVGLVLIGQATPRHAAHFRRRLGIELPVLADERRHSYAAAGARVATLGGLLGPKVLARGLRPMLSRRTHQGRPVGNVSQLGGALIVAPGGALVFERMARDASDNVAAEVLLAAARAAAPS